MARLLQVLYGAVWEHSVPNNFYVRKQMKQLHELFLRIKKRLFGKLCQCKEPLPSSPKKKRGRPSRRK